MDHEKIATLAEFTFVDEQIKKGTPAAQIHSLLVERGVDQMEAYRVVDHLLDQRLTEASHKVYKAGKNNMVLGTLWCTGGIIVTVVTYIAASGGGKYFLAWGAIIFGAIQFFRGLEQWNKGKSLVRPPVPTVPPQSRRSHSA